MPPLGSVRYMVGGLSFLFAVLLLLVVLGRLVEPPSPKALPKLLTLTLTLPVDVPRTLQMPPSGWVKSTVMLMSSLISSSSDSFPSTDSSSSFLVSSSFVRASAAGVSSPPPPRPLPLHQCWQSATQAATETARFGGAVRFSADLLKAEARARSGVRPASGTTRTPFGL